MVTWALSPVESAGAIDAPSSAPGTYRSCLQRPSLLGIAAGSLLSAHGRGTNQSCRFRSFARDEQIDDGMRTLAGVIRGKLLELGIA